MTDDGHETNQTVSRLNAIDLDPDIHSHHEVCLAFISEIQTPLVFKRRHDAFHAFNKVTVNLILKMSSEQPVQTDNWLFLLQLMDSGLKFRDVHE